MPFNTVLRSLRKDRKLTQSELAKLTGLTVSAISMYENGNREPSFETLEILADFFNVDMNFLLGRNQYKKKTFTESPLRVFPYTYIPNGISAGQMEDCEALTVLPKISIPDIIMGKHARDPRIVIMHVNGESMNRIIDNGATIAVITGIQREQLRDGDIVVAFNGTGYTIKRFYDDKENRLVILSPDSSDPAFHPITVPYAAPDGLRIFGRVVMYSVVL